MNEKDAATRRPDLVAVRGQRLAVFQAGVGPSVLLIHGIPTHSYLWRGVWPLLVGAGFAVTMVDLLGYGSSGKPENVDLGIAAQAEFVGDALAGIGWRRGVVVGHDIGGGVAQLLALERPAMVAGLVLVDSIAYDSFPEPGIARLKDPAWDAILGAPDFDLARGLTKGFLRGMVRSERVTPELIGAYERPFTGVDGRLAYLRAARALRTGELASRMGEIERLALPVLLVWGEADRFQPIGYGERLAAAMPGAGLEIIEQAGHFLPEDAPDALAASIVRFARARRER